MRTSTCWVRVLPEPLELTLLQDAQQLGLHFRRDVADLVQEQRAAVRELETAGAACRRARERALLVSEQLALEQARRQRRGAHPDERAVAPRAEVVDRARDQLLAGARLAEEQDRAVGRRHGLDRLQHLPQRGAGADDLAELVVKLAFEILLFVDQLRVEVGDFLVGAGFSRAMAICADVCPSSVTSSCEKASGCALPTYSAPSWPLRVTSGTQHIDSTPDAFITDAPSQPRSSISDRWNTPATPRSKGQAGG